MTKGQVSLIAIVLILLMMPVGLYFQIPTPVFGTIVLGIAAVSIAVNQRKQDRQDW